jgi:hypothetical protein
MEMAGNPIPGLVLDKPSLDLQVQMVDLGFKALSLQKVAVIHLLPIPQMKSLNKIQLHRLSLLEAEHTRVRSDGISRVMELLSFQKLKEEHHTVRLLPFQNAPLAMLVLETLMVITGLETRSSDLELPQRSLILTTMADSNRLILPLQVVILLKQFLRLQQLQFQSQQPLADGTHTGEHIQKVEIFGVAKQTVVVATQEKILYVLMLISLEMQVWKLATNHQGMKILMRKKSLRKLPMMTQLKATANTLFRLQVVLTRVRSDGQLYVMK